MMDSKRQASFNGEKKENGKKVSIIFSIRNVAEDLAAVLKVFESRNLSILHIESRKSRTREYEHEIFVDVEANGVDVKTAIEAARPKTTSIYIHDGSKLRKTISLDKGDTRYTSDGIPWFPRHVSDLDHSAIRVYMYGSELDADHPGFKDEVYRVRRKKFAEIAFEYKYGKPIPRIDYSEEDTKTWGTIYEELNRLYPTYACKEYLQNLPLLRDNCGYGPDAIPQLEDVSNYLREKTGFTLRPVAGYLSSRDFLAGLAFRVFHCTQYIRHSSDPFYTPEPDCCHELLGHMPLFLDASFAEFSQEIGLASLGATDQEVEKLATLYFFTIEFGLCRQQGQYRVYGAGLLSCVSELKHVLSKEAVIKPFDPATTCDAECRITTFQDAYYFTDTFEEAKEKLRVYARSIKRPFELKYDSYTKTVEVLDTAGRIYKALDDVTQQLVTVTNAMHKFSCR